MILLSSSARFFVLVQSTILLERNTALVALQDVLRGGGLGVLVVLYVSGKSQHAVVGFRAQSAWEMLKE